MEGFKFLLKWHYILLDILKEYFKTSIVIIIS